MAARKNFTIRFYDYEMEAIDKLAKEKGMERAEYIRDSCLKQNQFMGLNLIKPLCEMRKDLAEAKDSQGWRDKRITFNELIEKCERNCDELWKSVNL